MKPTVRKAIFAGRFYPQNPSELGQLIGEIVSAESKKFDHSFNFKKLLGGIVPHAGYIYSAYEAVHVYDLIKFNKEQFETFVIINPNHTGLGNNNFNTSSVAFWETPLGQIPVDKEFSEALNIEINDHAHQQEHSGEVQLPLLQYFLSYPFKIVMITMNRQTVENAEKLAQTIFAASQTTNRKIFVLASSDFSHYETPDEGFRKDQFVINQILTLNTKGIYQQIEQKKVTACGYGPIMTLIAYSKLAVCKPNIRLLRRGHSGEIHLSDKVVDYVSFLSYE